MPSRRASGQSERLRKVREEFWPDEDPWTGEANIDDGWFKAPRTLPLVLNLIRDKSLTPKGDPSNVYLELLSRQFGDGIVEIQNPKEHAHFAGYTSTRGTGRTWEEHMRSLEALGFIKIKGIGPNEFKYVFIVHPSTAIHKLETQGRLPAGWMDVYKDRRFVTKELSYEDRQVLRNRARIQEVEKSKPTVVGESKTA